MCELKFSLTLYRSLLFFTGDACEVLYGTDNGKLGLVKLHKLVYFLVFLFTLWALFLYQRRTRILLGYAERE